MHFHSNVCHLFVKACCIFTILTRCPQCAVIRAQNSESFAKHLVQLTRIFEKPMCYHYLDALNSCLRSTDSQYTERNETRLFC